MVSLETRPNIGISKTIVGIKEKSPLPPQWADGQDEQGLYRVGYKGLKLRASVSEGKHPRPGTQADALIDFLNRDLPRVQIAEFLEIDGSDLRVRVFYARRKGYLDPEKTPKYKYQKKLIENSFYSRVIKPYAEMGMVAVEIKEALKIVSGEEVNSTRINEWLAHARRVPYYDLSKPNDEARRDAKKQHYANKEKIKAKVALWLEIYQFMQQHDLPVFKNRLKWTRIIGEIEPLIAKGLSKEAIIKAKILTTWADSEDEKGFFKILPSGGKGRVPISFEGGVIFDSSELQLRKLKMIKINKEHTRAEEAKKAARLTSRT